MKDKIKAELLFILLTLVVAALIIFPVYLEYESRYPFYITNFVLIVVFTTLTRYIFLLRYTPFSHSKWIKVVSIFICIPLFLYLIDGMYEFQRFLDEIGLQEIAKNEDATSSANYNKFTRYQYLLFASGSLITCILFPLRMVISIWRQVNKNTI
jgi:hypothetical protein